MATTGPDSFVPDARVNYGQAQAAAPLRISNDRAQAANTTAAQFRSGTVNAVGQQALDVDPGTQQTQQNWQATGNWLMKAAGDQIAPYVKAYTESLAMDGIQQVASGKAIQEIIDEQPWYSRMFGDSDLIATARAYKAQEQVSKFTEQVTNQMGTMATASPEEAKQFILKSMNNFQTGDTLTDAATNQAMIAASEQLFSQWTKQNYKYRQYEARQSQLGAYASMGDAFDSQAKAHYIDNTVSSDSLNVGAQNFLKGLAPVEGQSPEAWSANIEDTIKGLASRGKFHAVNLIMTSGLTKSFDPDKLAGINSYIRTEESRVAAEVMANPEYAETIQNFMFNLKTGKQSPAEVLIQAQAINERAAKQYGFTNPMITPKQIQAWMGDSTDFSANEYNRMVQQQQTERMTAARKSGDIAEQEALTRQRTDEANRYFAAGGPLPQGGDNSMLQTIAVAKYDDMNKLNDGSGMKALVGLYINNGTTGIMKGLQQRFNAPLTTASQTAWTPEFDQAVMPTFNAMMSMPGGREAAVAYYGDNYERILSYQASLSAGVPAALAYNAAFVQPALLGDVSKLTKDQTSKLQSTIKDSYETQFPDFDFTQLNSAGISTVMNRATANLARIQNRPGMDTDQKYEEAVRMALHDGTLSLYGEYAWARNRENPQIHEVIKATPQQTYGLMRVIMEDDPRLKGANLEGAQFVEQPNANGSTSLMVYVKDGQGNYKSSVITTEDLKAGMRKSIEDQQYRSRLFRTSPQRALGYGQPLPSNMR